VDPYLVASVINSESKFQERALSSKGAYGLMQIMPATGEWISTYVDLDNFNNNMLYDPEINIKLGCWYLNNLSKEFNSQLDLVLASYNGGRGNVNKWLANSEYSKDGKTLNNIPFAETKEYVRKVKFSYKMYKILYDFNKNP
jgi:soluble lytic murein transglycosylase